MLRVLLLVMLVACDEGEDDLCDPAKHYIGLSPLDDVYNNWQPLPTAVGGSQRVKAHSYNDCGDHLADSAVSVQSLSPGVISATAIDTEVIELQAHAAGEVTLVVSNDMGLENMPTVEARQIAAVTASGEEKGDPQLYYPRGNLQIHLFDDGGRQLVDHGLSVVGDIARAPAWNQLDLGSATPGDHMLGIITGTATWDLTVHVVGSIDAIVAEHAMFTATTEYSPDVCFFPEFGGQNVGNVPLQFTVDGALHDTSYIPNCVLVLPEHDGTVTVTASALGHSAVTQIMFTP